MIKINNEVYDGVIMKPELDNALEHYGIKGMKWKKHKINLFGFGKNRDTKWGSENDRGYSRSEGTIKSQVKQKSYGQHGSLVSTRTFNEYENNSNLDAGIKAGRKRAAEYLKRKKLIKQGQDAIKKYKQKVANAQARQKYVR